MHYRIRFRIERRSKFPSFTSTLNDTRKNRYWSSLSIFIWLSCIKQPSCLVYFVSLQTNRMLRYLSYFGTIKVFLRRGGLEYQFIKRTSDSKGKGSLNLYGTKYQMANGKFRFWIFTVILSMTCRHRWLKQLLISDSAGDFNWLWVSGHYLSLKIALQNIFSAPTC